MTILIFAMNINISALSIKNVDFDNRVLELAIPERATDSQLEQLRRLQEYAQEQNIQLTIVLAK